MQSFSKLFFALLLILTGGLLLFVNMGIISAEIMENVVDYFPIVFIFYGLWLFIRSLINNKEISFWGIMFIGYGGMLTAAYSGYLEFQWYQVWQLWPLIIVYIGFSILVGGKRKIEVNVDVNKKSKDKNGDNQEHEDYSDVDKKTTKIKRDKVGEHVEKQKDKLVKLKELKKLKKLEKLKELDKIKHHVNSMDDIENLEDELDELKEDLEDIQDDIEDLEEDLEDLVDEFEETGYKDDSTTVLKLVRELTRKKPNWHVEPMNERFFIGNYELDFTQAFIPETLTEINLSGWIGDFTIVVPDDLAFSVYVKGGHIGSLSIVGKTFDGIFKDIQYETSDFETAERRVSFVIDYKICSLTIDRV